LAPVSLPKVHFAPKADVSLGWTGMSFAGHPC
jgi:hypothetical protein